MDEEDQGNLAFSLVPGFKLVLHLGENLPGNMDVVVGASDYTAIQILTSPQNFVAYAQH